MLAATFSVIKRDHLVRLLNVSSDSILEAWDLCLEVGEIYVM